jgi:hypothetical protein
MENTSAEDMYKDGRSMLYVPNLSARKLGRTRPTTLPAFKMASFDMEKVRASASMTNNLNEHGRTR